VTPDQGEAIEISDEIEFLSHGEVIERGTPEDIYARPKARSTAEFSGDAKFRAGEVIDNRPTHSLWTRPEGKIRALARRVYTSGERVDVFARKM
jgi:iron(III) transport system ATP-binding protein